MFSSLIPINPCEGGSSTVERFASVCLLVLAASAAGITHLHGQSVRSEHQIAAALQAAPENRRAEATVLGFDAAGALTTLKRGTNDIVCLADDPSDDGFSVACYHESLEPYMARGRELSAEGITDGQERNRIRWEAVEAGTLPMPEEPATLYVLTGSGFDVGTGTVTEPYLRYVLYTPWATVESTGLPDRPTGPGSPWLMFPGTAGAHIMISPPRSGGGR
jgi:hypothetical protein